MSSLIKITHASEEDVPAILTLIKELAQYEKLSHEVLATEASLKRALFEKKSAEVLLAYHAEALVGFAIFFHNFSTFQGRHGLYLEDLFVRPIARRKGVGLKLFSTLAKIAQERECGRMEWSVLDWNQLAINFYLKLGAAPLNDWTTFRLQGPQIKNLASNDDSAD